MKKTRIAVISDLHIGRKAIAADLCPHELTAEENVYLAANFLERFERFVNTPEFNCDGDIDFLCVTGDISNHAEPAEFELADKAILRIAQALKVDGSKIYYVPGNHDVHWPVMRLTPGHFWRDYRYEPLLQRGLIFQKQVLDARHGSFHQAPHFVAWVDGTTLVVGINSAAWDDPMPEHGKHHGLIHQETIDSLDLLLEDILEKEDINLKVCLLHHHPILYSDPSPNIPDFSVAANSDNLFRLLSKYKFDVVVHGHKHVPQLEHRLPIGNGHPITILGAGSFSAKLDDWVGLAQNQFHVVTIEGRNPATNGTFGHVSTWNFVGMKWQISQSREGLCATEGFGTLSTAAELEQEIDTLVGGLMGGSEACTWDALTKRQPALKHVKTKVAFDVFTQVAKSRGLTVFGEIDAPSRRWALLKM